MFSIILINDALFCKVVNQYLMQTKYITQKPIRNCINEEIKALDQIP